MAVVTFTLVFAGRVLAQTQSSLPPEGASALSKWGDCLHRWATEPNPANDDTDRLVDRNLARCKDDEQRAMAALEGRVGRDQALSLVQASRQQFREEVHLLDQQARGYVADPGVERRTR
jgi:hypothetical protein